MSDETVVRLTERRRKADEWALVLTAAGVPHRMAIHGTQWCLIVPADEASRAGAALDGYDDETSSEASIAPAAGAADDVAWTAGIAIGLLLLGFFAITGPSATGSRWFDAGAGSADAIRHGEMWRAVTALTLHVDVVHVVSNAVATAVLLAAVAERTGVGAGVLLVLLSGAAGNVASAFVHEPGHVSVGFSTATFGAIGILTALRLASVSRAPWSRGKRWIVIAAALLLLAMLGTSPHADVIAHALGLACGAVIGALAARALGAVQRVWIQSALLVVALAVVGGSWRAALAAASR